MIYYCIWQAGICPVGDEISSVRYAGQKTFQKMGTNLKYFLLAGLEREIYPLKLHSNFHWQLLGAGLYIYMCICMSSTYWYRPRGEMGWHNVAAKKIPTSGFTISEYYITVTRAQHEGVIQVYSQWPLFVCQCVCACFIAMSRCVLVRSLFREGLWWTSWGDGALRFMVWRQTPGVYC